MAPKDTTGPRSSERPLLPRLSVLSRFLAALAAASVVVYTAVTTSIGRRSTHREHTSQPPENSTPLAKPSTSQDRLFELHLAEYQAVMNRCNYLITLHVSALGLAPSILVFVVQQVSTARDNQWRGYALWLGALAIQTVLQVWVTLIEDQYNAVAYLEIDLRKRIATSAGHIPPNRFWKYENFLERTRMRESWWGEYLAPAILTVLFALLVYWRRYVSVAELVLTIANGLLIGVLYVRTYLRVQVRKRFARDLTAATDGTAA